MSNLTYFKAALESGLVNFLEGTGIMGVEITPCEVTKNNGLVKEGFSVKIPGRAVAPTFYFRDLYEMAAEAKETLGEAISYALEFIESKVRENPVSVLPDGDMDNVMVWEKVQGRIYIRLVNDDNPYLKDKIYLSKGNRLAEIFSVSLNAGENIASIIVTPDLLNTWGVSLDELRETALKNTGSSSSVLPMSKILAEISPFPILLGSEEKDPMLVITNRHRMYGNGAILCPGVLQEVAEYFGTDDFVLIPSSVHEWLAVTSDMPLQAAADMVADVNAAQVPPEERMPEAVYTCNPATGQLVCAKSAGWRASA